MVLVGYWPLNEESGDTAYDHSGNENHGTSNGAGPNGTGTVSGPLGSTAWDFDGTDDYVELGDGNNLYTESSLSTFTLSMWLYADGTSQVDTTSDTANVYSSEAVLEVIAGGSGSPDEPTWCLMLYNSGGQRIYGSASGSTWQHVVGVYNGTTAKIFIDGVEEGSQSMSQPVFDSYDRPTHIGAGGTSSPGSHYNGIISELRVYNHALTASEVQYLYTASQRGRQVTSKKSS